MSGTSTDRQREQIRLWWKNNPERAKYYQQKYYPKSRAKWQRRLYWLNKYKRAKGCEVCGFNSHGAALDLDHRDRAEKKFSISHRIPGASLKTLFLEIRKCQILCANCHRLKTCEEWSDLSK